MGLILLNNREVGINASNIDTGKGDFIVIPTVNNNADYTRTTVLKGNLFREMYNNQGWTDCLDTSSVNQGTELAVPYSLFDLDATVSVRFNKDILQTVYNIALHCSKLAHMEFPMQVSCGKANEIILKTKACMDFQDKNAIQTDKNGNKLRCNSTLPENERQQAVPQYLEAIITVQERVITFVVNKIYANPKLNSLCYKFSIPANENGVLKLKSNYQVFFGLCGWIRSDAINYITHTAYPTKGEFDGLHEYTVSSGCVHRILRGIENISESKDAMSKSNNDGDFSAGEIRNSILRTIVSADGALSKSYINSNELALFRGMPCCFGETWFKETLYSADGTKETGVSTVDDLISKRIRIVNTAYNSTTVNVQAVPMFALRGTQEGLCLCLRNNINVYCDWVHNNAGWKQQFEVLVDRRYDIVLDEEIMKMQCEGGKTLRVICCHFELHKPASAVLSKMLQDKGYKTYDSNGKVGMETEYIYSEWQRAFDFLRKKKGVTNITWAIVPKVVTDDADNPFPVQLFASAIMPNMILAYNEKVEGDNFVENTAFVLEKSITGTSQIRVYRLTGSATTLREYWYKGGKLESTSFSWAVEETNKSRVKINSIEYLETLQVAELNAPVLAQLVFNYLSRNKEIVAYPLENIAQYFDHVFQLTLLGEGYGLYKSKRAERVGDFNNPQDGYVPLQYKIDGDDDDSLTLLFRLSRKPDGKLNIAYKGASANNKVSASKSVDFNSFSGDTAITTAKSIFYEFASKLKLSCTSKADRFMGYYCNKHGYVITGLVHSKPVVKDTALPQATNTLFAINNQGSLFAKVLVSRLDFVTYGLQTQEQRGKYTTKLATGMSIKEMAKVYETSRSSAFEIQVTTNGGQVYNEQRM